MPPSGDADIATIASVIGHPARGRMLTAMVGGRALPASELAQAAGVAASTASAHLAKLTGSGLVAVERHGRHRYHRLASAQVAELIETMSLLAPAHEVRSLREANRRPAERAARSCYDHLAGAVGVAVADALCVRGALDRDDLTLRDPTPFAALGVDLDTLRPGRRRPPRPRPRPAGRSRARASTGATAARTSPASSAPRSSPPCSTPAGSRAAR